MTCGPSTQAPVTAEADPGGYFLVRVGCWCEDPEHLWTAVIGPSNFLDQDGSTIHAVVVNLAEGPK